MFIVYRNEQDYRLYAEEVDDTFSDFDHLPIALVTTLADMGRFGLSQDQISSIEIVEPK